MKFSIVAVFLVISTLNTVKADPAESEDDSCETLIRIDPKLKDLTLEQKVHCFFSCLWHRTDFIDNGGKIDDGKIQDYLKRDSFSAKETDGIRKCEQENPEGTGRFCEPDWKLLMCVSDSLCQAKNKSLNN